MKTRFIPPSSLLLSSYKEEALIVAILAKEKRLTDPARLKNLPSCTVALQAGAGLSFWILISSCKRRASLTYRVIASASSVWISRLPVCLRLSAIKAPAKAMLSHTQVA